MRHHIGEKIRVHQHKGDTTCYFEMTIEGTFPGLKQYMGMVHRVVSRGKEVPDSPLWGFRSTVAAESDRPWDWPDRIQKI
jgi:hypothetical protein